MAVDRDDYLIDLSLVGVESKIAPDEISEWDTELAVGSDRAIGAS